MLTALEQEGDEGLNITIHVDAEISETEIRISCNHLTPEIERVLATLRILDKQIMAKKEEETIVDRMVFEDCYSIIMNNDNHLSSG